MRKPESTTVQKSCLGDGGPPPRADRVTGSTEAGASLPVDVLQDGLYPPGLLDLVDGAREGRGHGRGPLAEL